MKMNRVLGGFSALFAGLTLVGCGEAREALDLQGSYQTGPMTEFSIRVGGVGCMVQEVEVTGFSMDLRQTAYAAADCSGKALGIVTTKGDFSVGKELAIAPGARELDLRIEKVEVKALDESWATVFGIDVTGDCQVNDVAVGTSKEVTGEDCGALGKYPAKDQIYFTSFNLVDGTLHFTKTPSEELEHVGTKGNPAPRNEDLDLEYFAK